WPDEHPSTSPALTGVPVAVGKVAPFSVGLQVPLMARSVTQSRLVGETLVTLTFGRPVESRWKVTWTPRFSEFALDLILFAMYQIVPATAIPMKIISTTPKTDVTAARSALLGLINTR